MGHALGIPVHGVCSLDALAEQALAEAPTASTRCSSRPTRGARRSTGRATRRVPTAPWPLRTEPAVDRPAELAADVAALPTAGAGRCSTPTCSRTARRPARRRPRLARAARRASPGGRLADAGRAALPAPPRRRSPPPSEVGRDRRRADPARGALVRHPGALAALETRPLRARRVVRPTWWAELAGRPRRDYVVLDRRRRRARLRRARPRRRGRRRHDARRRAARAGPRARPARSSTSWSAGRPAARRTSSSRCAPTTPPAAASTSAPASS